MRLKTYRAPDLATALANARAELGPNALVLATHEKKGRFGLPVVEVTVGGTREDAETRPDETVLDLARQVAALRDRLERDDHRESTAPPRQRPRPGAGTASVPVLDAAMRSLVASGLTPDLAARFARIAGRDLPTDPDARAVARAAARGMAEVVRFAPLPLAARCLFVVGPPGSGKTTTVAKLAARLAGSDDRPVFFAEADTERIGALEQAAIYAKYTRADLAWVESPDDLRRALEDAGETGMVLVDTPGIGSHDRKRLDSLLELRRAVPDADAAVLVPAGLHRRQASEVIERFAPFAPACAALTRVDDGLRHGELVSALAAAGIPLAFYTSGHVVPDDLEPATPHNLATLLLRQEQGPQNRKETIA